MSKKKRRKQEKTAMMPSQGAGLLRFFEEETQGLKIKPEFAIILAITLIIVCILAQSFF